MSTAQHSRHSAVGEVELRPDLARSHAENMRRQGVPDSAWSNLRIASLGQCRIICAVEGGRWHLSISHPFRLPTWDEINAARDALIPADVWLCQPMPPKAFWLNVHAHCLHLWELRDRELLVQWAYDGCQDEKRAESIVGAWLESRP